MFDSEQIPENGSIFRKARDFVRTQNKEWISKLVQTTLNETGTENNSGDERAQVERVQKYF